MDADPAAKSQDFPAHSATLLERDTEFTPGLFDRRRWRRDPSEHGKKREREQRALYRQGGLQMAALNRSD